MTDVVSDATTELVLFELLSLECRVDDTGTLRYYNALGQMHRVHGPAIEWADGSCDWYQNGRLHRLDGPAVIHAGGHRAWYQNDVLHRTDGPAVEYSDDSKSWFINGKKLTEAEWLQVVASMETV